MPLLGSTEKTPLILFLEVVHAQKARKAQKSIQKQSDLVANHHGHSLVRHRWGLDSSYELEGFRVAGALRKFLQLQQTLSRSVIRGKIHRLFWPKAAGIYDGTVGRRVNRRLSFQHCGRHQSRVDTHGHVAGIGAPGRLAHGRRSPASRNSIPNPRCRSSNPDCVLHRRCCAAKCIPGSYKYVITRRNTHLSFCRKACFTCKAHSELRDSTPVSEPTATKKALPTAAVGNSGATQPSARCQTVRCHGLQVASVRPVGKEVAVRDRGLVARAVQSGMGDSASHYGYVVRDKSG